MKKTVLRLAAILPLLLTTFSCNEWLMPSSHGEMSFRFDGTFSQIATRASGAEIPDTNDFILKVCDSSGKPLYDGPYGGVPDPLALDPGTYTVSAVSAVFSKPEFSVPQFGDEQVVVIRSGERTDVKLMCRRMNAGVRLRIASSFLDERPQSVLLLKNDRGSLMYGYSERRIAYFPPGNVSLVMSENGKDNILLTRILDAGDILTLSVSASSRTNGGNGLSIAVDTTGNWISDSFVVGGTNGGDGGIVGVNEARTMAGVKSVWVTGFIVGGDLTSSKVKFAGPFTSQTNLAIAGRSSCTDRDMCMSVQLQKGEVRDALNLVTNPSNIGRKIYVKGDIVASYYGIPGIQNISEFRME